MGWRNPSASLSEDLAPPGVPSTLQLHSGSLAPEIWRPSLGAAPLVRLVCSPKALLLCPLRCRLLPHLSLRRPSRLLCPLLYAPRPCLGGGRVPGAPPDGLSLSVCRAS